MTAREIWAQTDKGEEVRPEMGTSGTRVDEAREARETHLCP